MLAPRSFKSWAQKHEIFPKKSIECQIEHLHSLFPRISKFLHLDNLVSKANNSATINLLMEASPTNKLSNLYIFCISSFEVKYTITIKRIKMQKFIEIETQNLFMGKK